MTVVESPPARGNCWSRRWRRLDRHQRIHAEVEEAALRVERRSRLQPERPADLVVEVFEQRLAALMWADVREAAAQVGRSGRRRSPPRREERRDQPGRAPLREVLAEACPIDVRHRGLWCAAGQELFEGIEGEFGLHVVHAGESALTLPGVGASHAEPAPGSPVHGQRRQTERGTQMRQGIHKRIGGRIPARAALTQQRRHRREQDEEVERQAGRACVQVPRSEHLGGHHRRPAFRRLLRKQTILGDAGRVDDARQRRHGVKLLEDALDIVEVGHVAAAMGDLAARLAQLRESRQRLRRRGTTAHEREVAALRSTSRPATANPSPPVPPVIR